LYPTGSHGAHDRSIRQALEQGSLSVQDIDACTMRMLRLVNTYKATKVGRVDIDWDEHDRLARQAARESIVLLRNDNNLLPLARNTPIALIGDFAKDHPRIQGMGSAQVTPYRVETVYDAIQQYTDRVVFAQGYSGEDDHPTELNAELLSEAVDVARQGDVVLLFLGLPEIMESEGMDRAHMSLPAQHYALWNEIVAVNDNVVVILTNGGTVQLPDTYIKTRAILEGYLLGQAGGGAMCDILFGQQSPCGKLAETMPVSQTDILGDRYFPGDRDVVAYMEGLDVGYRQFNTTNSRVRYPFGHGLSYTSFSFANLRVHVDIDNEDEKAVRVEFDIRNTGSMAGKEVVQLYMRDVLASVYRPFHELRAYDKVSVEPGETKTLTMVLNSDAFSFWDIGRSDWTVEPGDFEIQIGSSSLDIALRETISLTTGNFASDQAIEAYPLKDNALEEVSPDVFVKRFGSLADVVSTAMVDSENNPSELFDRNSLLKETAKVSIIGRLFLHIVFTEASREIKPGQSEQRQKKMIRTNVENIPLRVLVLFSKGGLSFALLDGIIAILNGSYLFALVCFAYASMYAVRDTVSELCRCRKP
jgi:beta-glucosidase